MISVKFLRRDQQPQAPANSAGRPPAGHQCLAGCIYAQQVASRAAPRRGASVLGARVSSNAAPPPANYLALIAGCIL
jgi:hypothetical protein